MITVDPDMEMQYLIIYPGILSLLACLVIPFLAGSRKSTAAVLVVLLNAISTTVVAVQALSGASAEIRLEGGFVFGEILFRVDPLSAWFILLINLTCFNAAWYGTRYMKPYVAQGSNLSLHWSSFVVFHFSMIAVCSVQHALAFLVAWEIMTLTSFLLLMFEHNRFQTLNAGMNYLVQMHIAVMFLTAGFIWVSVSEGSYGFDALARFFQRPDSAWLFAIFFVGFGLKAGFIPLHTWLPHAHPAAPTHISAVMSAVMIKMGIYGIIRTAGWLTADVLVVGAVILALSALTAFYGILSAAIHRDYKRVLAFSSIENIGMIGMAIGTALMGKGLGNYPLMAIGFAAALVHTLNHSLYKSLLFFCAGNIYLLTHTRNMEHLGGIIKRAPVTAFFFLTGATAICGFPPFNGFVSKFLLFTGLLEGVRSPDFQSNIVMISAMAGMALISGAALLTFAKAFSVIFLGVQRDITIHPRQEYLNGGHLPFFLILFIMLLIGVSPASVLKPVELIVAGLTTKGSTITGQVFPPVLSIVSHAGLASFIFIILAAATYLLRSRIISKSPVEQRPTWGCGYPVAIPRAQYTGKSFSKTLAKLFAFVASEEKKFSEIDPRTVFPSPRTYQSSYAEFFEKNVLSKLSNVLLNFMNYFSFIQHGRVQHYILYGLLFILLLIFASLLNIV